MITVGLATICAELTRKYFSDKAEAIKKAEREQQEKEQKEHRAVEKERKFRERLINLEESLLQMENSKMELLHEKIVQDQLQHLEITKEVIARIDILDRMLNINTAHIVRNMSVEELEKLQTKITTAMPRKELPTFIKNIGQESIEKEAAYIANPAFAEIARAEYIAQELEIEHKRKILEEKQKESALLQQQQLAADQQQHINEDGILDVGYADFPQPITISRLSETKSKYQQREKNEEKDKYSTNEICDDKNCEMKDTEHYIQRKFCKPLSTEAAQFEDKMRDTIFVPFNAVPLTVESITQKEIDDKNGETNAITHLTQDNDEHKASRFKYNTAHFLRKIHEYESILKSMKNAMDKSGDSDIVEENENNNKKSEDIVIANAN